MAVARRLELYKFDPSSSERLFGTPHGHVATLLSSASGDTLEWRRDRRLGCLNYCQRGCQAKRVVDTARIAPAGPSGVRWWVRGHEPDPFRADSRSR